MVNLSIAQAISKWIELQPDMPAIYENEMAITYGDLDRRAAGIACALEALGGQKGDLVPIITSGGADMIAGMIACLRLSMIFVPLDVAAPIHRTKQMLLDLSPSLAIVDRNHDASELLGSAIQSVTSEQTGSNKSVSSLDDETIIYGFFTSGSTGLPKCCLNTHLGLSNRFKFNSMVRPLGPGDAILQNSKHTFDPVLWQTLWPLTCGATVVIPDRKGLLDIEKTVNTIHRRHVVMTDIVPSVLSVLLDYLELNPSEAHKVDSLRDLFVGGEEISQLLVMRSHKVLPQVRLTNTYGPTEAAIGMIYHHFDGTEGADIPLGTPIPGTNATILDEELKPVKNGETGQLAISGNCLGVGYLNDDTKTADSFKFVDVGKKKERVFLTGDRAVVKDGLIFFRGRTDKQLKIRGVRVELKEIELFLERQPEVVQCRVVPISNAKGDIQLVAFFTTRTALTEQELRGRAQAHFPSEFVPSKFTPIDQFETTSSGKIDRAVLKELAAQAVLDSTPSVSRTVENIVQDHICREVTDDENLFDAGLDSLSAMRIALRIEEAFHVKVSVSDLYSNPTVAGITQLVSQDLPRDPKPDTLRNIVRWSNVNVSRIPKREKVLLTGATGYLGSHLLSKLSNMGPQVVCLVRSNSVVSALHRLHNVSYEFGTHSDVNWSNVEVVLGDLSLDQLGLKRSDLDSLTGALSAIYNAGADVSFVKSFSQLESCNVRSVIELAKLAISATDCHLHHVSSTAVLGDNALPLNAPSPLPEFPPHNGYAQSKLAAELALQSMMRADLDASIYRVGELMPSPKFSVPNSKSNVVCFLRTLSYVGLAPDSDDSLDYCPVDTVSEAIAESRKNQVGFIGAANQNRIQLRLLVEGLSSSGQEISIVPKKTVYEAVEQASALSNVPDFVSITWSSLRHCTPADHWPFLSMIETPEPREGDFVTWPKIGSSYLSDALRNISVESATNTLKTLETV